MNLRKILKNVARKTIGWILIIFSALCFISLYIPLARGEFGTFLTGLLFSLVLLARAIETAKVNIGKKKSLIEKDMGIDALNLVDHLDEGIFKSSEIFFSIIPDLWKSLHFV